ncbi:MAG: hypothetical protein K6E47_07725 [Lachnospiraceae bacterium]|nr:hypothetical protein [Lachnospiraceae bacterium]
MAENYGTLEGTLDAHDTLEGEMNNHSDLTGEIQFGGGGGRVYVITKTTAEWNATPQRKSIVDTIYVYSDARSVTDPETGVVTLIPRMKVGDGTTYIVDLPFSTMSITQDDIDAWNAKSTLQVEADEETETLIFTE